MMLGKGQGHKDVKGDAVRNNVNPAIRIPHTNTVPCIGEKGKIFLKGRIISA